MHSSLKWALAALLAFLVFALAYPSARAYWKSRTAPKYRQAKVARGEIVAVVNATGTVQPVLSVRVGSFVSGPVKQLCVDYNDRVKKGDLLAEIDPRIYRAIKARDEAALANAYAEVERVGALLLMATRDFERATALREENSQFISDSEIDKYRFEALALQAQVQVAEAMVRQAAANLENSTTNLEYTKIVSPVDGIVIERRIDEGQTLAAQFQTPDLFIVAPDLEREIYIFASVDEADIGLIREAQRRRQPVFFTVDAYPNDLFQGVIEEGHGLRMNPTTEQNVVTYPVVVSAANPDLKLLPGMTADLSFQVQQRKDILKAPNAALRFYPQVQHVRLADRKLLEGEEEGTGRDANEVTLDSRSAAQRVRDEQDQRRRHVWVVDGDFLRAVEVVVGLNDYKYTEVVSGDLQEGQSVVTGIKK